MPFHPLKNDQKLRMTLHYNLYMNVTKEMLISKILRTQQSAVWLFKGGNFDPLTYKWVDMGYASFLTGRKQIAKKEMG